MMSRLTDIRPQPGAQEEFLSTPADIAIYGGAAGGGKSFGLLLEPLRHHNNARFGSIIFRRKSPQLVGSGSLWEKAQALYRPLGAVPRSSPSHSMTFPSGAFVAFQHLQHESTKFDHQGKEYALIGFDELTHFTEGQFWYLLSRNRSLSGVSPYVRATTNPDPDHFVRKLIDWWIDQDTGYAIPERSGVLRYFVRLNDELHWGDSPEELAEKYEVDVSAALSLTFIPASLDDNPILTEIDKGYEAKLDALGDVERERLKRGNWNIREGGGTYFRDDYFVRRWSPGELPPLLIYAGSDFAVTEPHERNKDPDFTEHGFVGFDASGNVYVLDWWFGRTGPDVWIDRLIDMLIEHEPEMWVGEKGVIKNSVETMLEQRMEERECYTHIEWVGTQGGQTNTASREGFKDRSKQAKAIRGRPVQARARWGRLIFPANAPWVNHVVSTLVGFPAVTHDDSLDVFSNIFQARGTDKASAPSTPRSKKRDRYDDEPMEAEDSWRTA